MAAVTKKQVQAVFAAAQAATTPEAATEALIDDAHGLTPLFNQNSGGGGDVSPMAAKSVKANPTNASALPTDLAATSPDQVLQAKADGTGLEWGQARTRGITDKAVTYEKIQDVSATNRVLGRVSPESGSVEEITPANLRSIIVSDIPDVALPKAKQFTIGNGTDSAITITHGLVSAKIVDVTFSQVSDGASFSAGWHIASSEAIQVSIKPPPATSSVVVSVEYLSP